MKTYSSASNARRAAKTQIKDIDAPVEGTHYTVEGNKADGFWWRRVQVEAPKADPAVADQPIAPPKKRATKEDYKHLGLDKAPEYAEPPEDASVAPEQEENEGLDDINFAKPDRRKGAVREVWDICEENKDLRRKDVIEMCVAKGINFYTARTQYQAWYRASKNSGTK